MRKISNLGVFAAVAVGAAVALASHAGEVQTPSSVSESAPDKTGKKAKGAAGVPTLPSTSGPSSVSESAQQKTGKEPPMTKSNDSKNMPNLKTPAQVSESAPDKSADQDKRKRSDKY